MGGKDVVRLTNKQCLPNIYLPNIAQLSDLFLCEVSKRRSKWILELKHIPCFWEMQAWFLLCYFAQVPQRWHKHHLLMWDVTQLTNWRAQIFTRFWLWSWSDNRPCELARLYCQALVNWYGKSRRWTITSADNIIQSLLLGMFSMALHSDSKKKMFK